MNIAIERKPESGCEIQNSACNKSGMMLRLKIVKHIETEDQQTIVGPKELPLLEQWEASPVSALAQGTIKLC